MQRKLSFLSSDLSGSPAVMLSVAVTSSVYCRLLMSLPSISTELSLWWVPLWKTDLVTEVPMSQQWTLSKSYSDVFSSCHQDIRSESPGQVDYFSFFFISAYRSCWKIIVQLCCVSLLCGFIMFLWSFSLFFHPLICLLLFITQKHTQVSL